VEILGLLGLSYFPSQRPEWKTWSSGKHLFTCLFTYWHLQLVISSFSYVEGVDYIYSFYYFYCSFCILENMLEK
jgi:hypothetical protein